MWAFPGGAFKALIQVRLVTALSTRYILTMNQFQVAQRWTDPWKTRHLRSRVIAMVKKSWLLNIPRDVNHKKGTTRKNSKSKTEPIKEIWWPTLSTSPRSLTIGYIRGYVEQLFMQHWNFMLQREQEGCTSLFKMPNFQLSLLYTTKVWLKSIMFLIVNIAKDEYLRSSGLN